MAHLVPCLLLPEGTPTFSNSMGRYVTVPGELPVQLLHHDYDIFWVQSGEAEWKFRDGTFIRATKDQFMVLPPYVPVWVNEVQPPMTFWYCHFAFRPLPERLPPQRRPDFAGPGKQASVPMFFTRKDAPKVHRAYRVATELRFDPLREPWQLERAIITLIAELAKFALSLKAESPSAPSRFETEPLDARVAELRRIIDENPTRSWLVTELAATAGITPGHLHALCRRVLGKPIKRYLIEARLRHAMKLLKEKRNGELPSVYDVSEACGFSSQHFFSRQFKAYFNMTPLAFRNGSTLS